MDLMNVEVATVVVFDRYVKKLSIKSSERENIIAVELMILLLPLLFKGMEEEEEEEEEEFDLITDAFEQVL